MSLMMLGFRQYSKAFSLLERSNPCSFYKRASSFMVGPRKLTFGKKTDTELLVKLMKLERHEKFKCLLPSSSCAELLANTCEDMDYKMVRSIQPFFLHYRVDLLLQRVRYMETLKFTPRQKRRDVECHPPVFMLSFTPEDYSVNYLRGVIHCSGEDEHGKTKFIHLLYKCCPKLRSYSFKIEENLSVICQELGITHHCALKMAINMPSFLLWNIAEAGKQFRVIHRDHGLPFGYDLDAHTAPIFPLVLNPLIKIPYNLFTNKPDKTLANSLPWFSISDVLEYGFVLKHGGGKPEDLSEFLIANSRAEGANENSELY